MENPQDRSLKELETDTAVYDFITNNNSDYDFIGRSIEYMIEEEHISQESDYIDLLLVDFDSPSFRITDFTYGAPDWVEIRNQMKPTQRVLAERVEKFCFETDWSGQIKSIRPESRPNDYTPKVLGELYTEVAIDNEKASLLDEISSGVLGYGFEAWEHKYDWIEDIR